MIVKAIQKNNLKPAEKNDSIEKIRATDKLSAYMIADEFHPLIDNKVLDIMNEGIEEIEFKALNFILNKFSLSYFDR
ncbi:hypothetical protein [Halanaerobium sp.]|jgi:hypothetical protein|nr:hypothetical protein [Halanaerobium sp.]PUU94009.1 MAG: hypothetical protein CI949_1036 [Halanaerobium sp.]